VGINRTTARQVLSAATVVAAFGLSGCASPAPEPAAAPPVAATAPAPSQPNALPQPDALTSVLDRLADPAVPGADKLPLVESASGAEADELDRFARALRDNRMLPLTFAATALRWSDPGYVTADVTMTPADPGAAGFSYPMDFTAAGSGWQLSKKTADLLLAVDTGPSPTATPTPAPIPAPAPPTPTR
jgi:hypothetical protein